MTREQSYMRMLLATVNTQRNIAHILNAKAAETEKVRNWFINHLYSENFSNQQEQLEQSLQMHDQVVEVIDGITKLNMGIVSVMKVVLQEDDEEDQDEDED